MKNDKRISSGMEELLQNQIKEEAQSGHIYVHMGNWCNINGYFKAEKFFKKHADEERTHMHAMIDYLNDRNCEAQTPGLDAVTLSFTKLKDVIQGAYDHEKVVTEKLSSIYRLSLSGEDFVTMQFIGKYVNEQREEEALFNDLNIQLELAADNMAAIFHVEESME